MHAGRVTRDLVLYLNFCFGCPYLLFVSCLIAWAANRATLVTPRRQEYLADPHTVLVGINKKSERTIKTNSKAFLRPSRYYSYILIYVSTQIIGSTIVKSLSSRRDVKINVHCRCVRSMIFLYVMTWQSFGKDIPYSHRTASVYCCRQTLAYPSKSDISHNLLPSRPGIRRIESCACVHWHGIHNIFSYDNDSWQEE